MRASHSACRSLIKFVNLLLAYTLTISLFAPFAVRRVAAAPTGPAAVPTPAEGAKSKRRDGELLVRFREDASEQDRSALADAGGAHRGRRLRGKSRVEIFTLRHGQDADALAAELRRSPIVELVEPNFLISRDEVTPGDPRFAEQWALKNTGAGGGQPGADIQAAEAWETTTGSPTTVIAVIDSGIDFTHPDLQSNQWTNSGERQNGRDDDHDGFADDLHGWDWVANSGAIRDEQGHGTAVAGIIAAQGNNSVGVTGVMWRASLMSLRVLDNTGVGDVADAVEAIDYAADHGAQVINCSWGTDGESQALKDAIARVGRGGVVVVSSAGNGGRDIDREPYYPASYDLPNQIAVASTDGFDRLTPWSNYGATNVMVAAPGTDILTTRLGGDYTTVTGTSASTPLVAGVVGLIKTRRWWLSAAGTKTAIINGARKVAELSGKVSSGGVVSAAGALGALQGPNTPPPGDGNSNNGGSGGSGNGNSNGGNGGNPRITPPVPGRGSGGTDRNGGFTVTAPPTTRTLPGTGNYNLDQMLRTQSAQPRTRAPIHADVLPMCDINCGGEAPQSDGSSDPYFATARTRPENETGQPGVDLGSENFNWNLPILDMPGRAGLDLSLVLSYNSLVWTKQTTFLTNITFNADRGFPGPGFHLGFPILQAKYYDTDEGSNSFLLITPEGGRIQLHQIGTSDIYESVDSSYTQLVDNRPAGGNLVVRTMNGAQMFFSPAVDGDFRCTQIEDRNGNYITIAYNSLSRISTITDTLGRVFTFNYDTNNYLNSITQIWNGQTHTWATFSFGELYMQPSFASGIRVLGPRNTTIPVLTQVSLDDGSYYTFSYTSFGQVNRVTRYAPNGAQLAYTSYNLSTSAGQTDCPRFTERRDWATHWNNDQEVVANYSMAGDGSWSQVTMPDGVVYKELFATTGWQKGLATGTEVWIPDPNNTGSYVKKKWAETFWTQDDTSLPYQKNPRPYDMSTYDEANNRRHVDITYTSYGLPYEVREYSADGSGFGGFMRRTYTDYRFDQTYIDRHIIGLVSAVHVVDENNNLVTKVTYDYDRGGEYLSGTPQATLQHDDTNYGVGVVYGRGNQTDVWRWDVTDPNNSAKAIRQSHAGYDTNGSVVFTRDALDHQTAISYTDSFYDNTNRNTFAYPTTITDPDGKTSSTQYDYYFGAVTRSTDPRGATQTMEYDAARRRTKATAQFGTNMDYGHTRWFYSDGQDWVAIHRTIKDSQEHVSFTWNDGAGRIHGAGGELPNSVGGFFVKKTVYDVMGRPVQVSNPTEIYGTVVPAGDDAAGFAWTYQQYDWNGRPTLTTLPSTDGGQTSATVEAIYGGCGCAGGEVVTLRDERGRRRRLTSDVVGRLKKVEELDWDQSVYSTSTYSYNARDQITGINQAGQTRAFEFDGHGRLWRRTTPEQGQTTYSYFADDALQTMTDARGATTTFAYNNRHLVKDITYGVPSGVAATPSAHFEYDEAGNRTLMTDGLGSVTYHYDQLSRMDWEERTFTGVGTYKTSYGYDVSGQLTSVTNSWGYGFTYSRDYMGRVTDVNSFGTPYSGVSTYLSNVHYRAWGALKDASYGNGRALSMGYDSRLRLTRWDVANVLGYQYSYNYFNENSGRVTFASQLYDHTLDRSYDYDNVGRMWASHSGREARWHTGQETYSGADGPYAQNYAFDKVGNIAGRNGWGAANSQYYYGPQFINNRMTVNPVTGTAVEYDAAGNLKNDGQQSYVYDATGQQTYASGTGLTQGYDGDGKRAVKTETVNGTTRTTYYLRSSVLGGQIISEISSTGSWARGYVYLGGQLIAIQYAGVSWVHQDPVTKSQRLTDANGNITSWVELDPWGAETGRSSNSQFQPHRFTSYERDGNSGDDAMMRRYEGNWQRFSQPDPTDSSYDLSNPQSFNRYAYTQGDPVNLVDPSGLDPIPGFCSAQFSYAECGGFAGITGGYFGDNYASYMRVYGGMSAEAAGGLRQHVERVGNAMAGNGYRTNDEVIRDLNFEIRYGYNSDGGIWTDFNIQVTVGDDYFSAMNNVINIGGTGASIGEYGNVIDSAALGIHEWRGLNGGRYALNWGGNGATGGRSLAVAKAGAWRALGRVFFAASVLMSLYQVYNGGSKGKAALDITMAAIGTFGGPIGATVAFVYFLVDSTIGWEKVINAIRPKHYILI